jgi:hypothetical protein
MPLDPGLMPPFETKTMLLQLTVPIENRLVAHVWAVQYNVFL